VTFVTFVLFVVTKCLTTKDAKYTKEEIQKRPQRIKILFVGRRRQTKHYSNQTCKFLPNRRLPIGQNFLPQRTLPFDRLKVPSSVEGRLCGEMSESLSAIIGENLRLKLFAGLAQPEADPSFGGGLARETFVSCS